MNKKYTEQDILKAFQDFYKAHGRYPTRKDEFSPNFKTIDRKYGSIKKFREKFNLVHSDGRATPERRNLTKQLSNIKFEAYGLIQTALFKKTGVKPTRPFSGNYFLSDGTLYHYFINKDINSVIKKVKLISNTDKIILINLDNTTQCSTIDNIKITTLEKFLNETI